MGEAGAGGKVEGKEDGVIWIWGKGVCLLGQGGRGEKPMEGGGG